MKLNTKIELNSSIIHLNKLGTYHNYGDAEWTLNEDNIENDFEDGYTDISPNYYWMNFDNKKYMIDWNERVFNYINTTLFEEIFKQLNIDYNLTNLGYYSPREYNFETDCCDFELEVNWDQFRLSIFDYLNKDNNRELFKDFLEEHYTSYDGFMSFTANNYEEWFRDFQLQRIQEIAAIISFLIYQDDLYGKEKIENDALYDIFTDMYYTEYVDYTILDDFLQNIDKYNEETAEDWQKDIINRNKQLENG